MKIISIPLSESTSETALKKFGPYISNATFKSKFHPKVFDLKMAGVQSELLLLHYLHMQAKLNNSWTYNSKFINYLKFFKSFSGNKFHEFINKCLTVLILSKELKNIKDITEEIPLGNKILDLKIDYKNNNPDYIEISTITLNY